MDMPEIYSDISRQRSPLVALLEALIMPGIRVYRQNQHWSPNTLDELKWQFITTYHLYHLSIDSYVSTYYSVVNGVNQS